MQDFTLYDKCPRICHTFLWELSHQNRHFEGFYHTLALYDTKIILQRVIF